MVDSYVILYIIKYRVTTMNSLTTQQFPDLATIALSLTGISDNTKQTYLMSMRSYSKYCTDNKLELSIDSLKTWITSAKKPRTQSLRIAAARRIFNEVFANHPKLKELMDSIADIKVIKIDNSVKESEYLSNDEVQKLIAASSPKIALMIKTLYLTGLRITELLSIRHDDCIYIRDGRVVQISLVGKRMKQNTVFIPADLYSEIVSVFGGDEFMFSHEGKKYNRSYVSNAIAKAGVDIGKDVSAHSIRHSFAQKLLERGVSIDKISKSLCHASISTTANFYLHGRASIEELGILE